MMRSATAFLPPSMITFMNLDNSTLPNLGSGRISRLGTSRRRGIFSPLLLQLVFLQTPRELINKTLTYSTRTLGHFVHSLRHAANKHLLIKYNGLFSLRRLGTVLGTRLLAIFYALQVKRTAHDVVTHTWQILDATTTHQHNRVLLQVVAFAADVRNNFKPVGQTHFGDFTQSRVWFFGRRGIHTGADTPTLRRILHRRAF